ncbi:MAG: CPBP family intramembrane metalloprotease [Gammaproteobacteria bacterium]|nr:CPBP family intramembrane metalloprotease [Gammaproteobacteria bacterium]
MYALLVFVLLVALVLIAGAALAYPVHAFLGLWLETDFEEVAKRTVLGLGIFALVALFRTFGFRTLQDIGFTSKGSQFWKDSLTGFGVGVLIMGPVITGLLLSRNRVLDLQWDWSFSGVALLLATAVISGTAVALLEETIFRGALLSAILRRSSVSLAVLSTSFMYALVHFLEPGAPVDPDALGWGSGLILLRDAFTFLYHPALIFDSFIALFAAGILLALVRVQTGGLAACIGIHAGWGFTIKIFKRVTNSNQDTSFAFLTGNYDHVIGYLATLVLILAIGIYLGISRQTGERTGMG